MYCFEVLPGYYGYLFIITLEPNIILVWGEAGGLPGLGSVDGPPDPLLEDARVEFKSTAGDTAAHRVGHLVVRLRRRRVGFTKHLENATFCVFGPERGVCQPWSLTLEIVEVHVPGPHTRDIVTGGDRGPQVEDNRIQTVSMQRTVRLIPALLTKAVHFKWSGDVVGEFADVVPRGGGGEPLEL